ncbi:ABC transporter substrate-binding protein [Edaphocola aurantiacus]|uniref:ABC transporter substrate-binding protein n=1 Tax=Edaphocola aurantiacus TaxID=2601682 RepID=UPI00293D3677|nr:ABC transporter substrate-binding protein [Edaphocola aurantiacus]
MLRNSIVCLLCLVFLSSCTQKAKERKMVFRYNQAGGLETLDPAFAKNLSIMWGVHFIFNTLTEVDKELKVTPSLAQSWELSEDGLQYTFHIRRDVYFHDNEAFPGGKGRRMTAYDIQYSFDRLIDPLTASSGAWIFNDRVRSKQPFEAINDSTFLIHLNQPFRPLPEILSMPYCSVVPHEVVRKWGKDFRNHPCGTGPFRFQYWDEGNTLVLHKHPGYWEQDSSGQKLPYLDAVQVSFNDTKATEFLLFLQKKLDFVNGLDGSFKDLVLTKKGTLKPDFQDKIRLKKLVYLNTEYLGILVDKENAKLKGTPLLHPKVRLAINYAIDRNKIVTYFRNGVGIPATTGFIPKGMPGTEKRLATPYEYNPAKALQLLAEAGYPNGKGLAPIILQCPEANVDVCNFVATQLNDIGIPARVQVMQPGLLRQEMSRSQAPFFKAQWIADYPDAETYLAFFYSKFPAPPNYTRFNDPVFDHLYERSLQAEDDATRFHMYAQMDSLISSKAPVVPLFYDEMLHFTQNNISGFEENPLNIIDLKRVKVNK